MKFGKRYSNATVFMAMLQGILIGVAAVVVIGLVLIVTKGKGDINASGEEVPTTGPPAAETPTSAPENALPLFAKQHGVFSTAESAAQFIAEDSSLAKAAVIQAGENYFVWSAVGLTESEIETNGNEGTYRKAFSVDASACGAIGAGKLREVLAETEIDKIKKLIAEQKSGGEEGEVKDFHKNMTAITAFTSDLRIIRLQLLSYYSSAKNCAKFTF
ncbi:hypothetical protein [Sporosarcina sp. NPDC096371]|uniref:hypothetical protein n=1 Tax=Sporosarcina sp. NPDC096371 TaxID=3364530 RepID=UPI00382E4A0B